MSSKNEELLDNKYSLKKSTVPGTFFHNLPYVEHISTNNDKNESMNNRKKLQIITVGELKEILVNLKFNHM